MLHQIVRKDTSLLFSTPIVQQTAFWSLVKRNLGLSSFAVEFKPYKDFCERDWKNRSDMLVILRFLDSNHAIAHVPYGPELEPREEYQGSFLEELSECLRSYLPKQCLMIRYELCWESYWAKGEDNYDHQGNWKGEPEVFAQEFRFNYSTVKKNFRKAHGNSLPSSTIYINLLRERQSILNSMKPKTRYNIRLAEKRGVNVKLAGPESLDTWYNLYRESSTRNRFVLHDKRYFESLMQANADDTLSPAKVKLLVAEYQNKPLAAMFLVISHDRGTFMYGASSSDHRNLMPSYALQWKAISTCKEWGCKSYDMFGVAPGPTRSHPLYGLYKFKTGFGGNIYHSLGSWDYPLNQKKYNIFRAHELNTLGFHQ